RESRGCMRAACPGDTRAAGARGPLWPRESDRAQPAPEVLWRLLQVLRPRGVAALAPQGLGDLELVSPLEPRVGQGLDDALIRGWGLIGRRQAQHPGHLGRGVAPGAGGGHGQRRWEAGRRGALVALRPAALAVAVPA